MEIIRRVAIIDVLRNARFRFLWFAQASSQIGINILTFALALRIYELTHKNTAVSILALTVAIPALLFGAVAGTLVDRYDKKMVLFFCNLSRAVAVLGFLLTRESIFFIYLLLIAISVITQFFVPAEAPTIPLLVEKEDLLSANGTFTLTIFATMLAGGLLAGPLLDLIGIDRTFLFIALLFGLASYFISRLPGQTALSFLQRRSRNFHPEDIFVALENGWMSRLKQEFYEGIDFLRSHRKVRTALLILVGSQTVVASISSLLPGFADQVVKIPINDASVFLLGPAILGIISGALFVSQFGHFLSRDKIINSGIFCVGLFLLLLGWGRTVGLAQFFLFALGFSNALIDVTSNTALQEGTTEAVRSRVYGVLTSLGGAFFILPIIFSGILSDILGVGEVLMIFGGLIIVVWLVKIGKVRLL